VLPKSVRRASGLSAGAKLVLWALWEDLGRWNHSATEWFLAISVEGVSRLLGLRVRGVYQNLTKLEAKGFIRRDRDISGRRGYTLIHSDGQPAASRAKVEQAARESIPPKLRFAVFRRDCFRCCYCGARSTDVTLTIDHVIPVARGGTNDIDNLRTACFPCNVGKSTTLVEAVQ
jgi:DNA-binding MarR family transcriptional regulator